MTDSKKTSKQQEDMLRIQDILSICLARWRWYIVSLFVCLGGATLYLLHTPPTYTRMAAILIKEDGGGSNSFSSEIGSFADMGMFSSSSDVNNELAFMQSPALAAAVVRRLGLYMNYSEEGIFYNRTLYGRTLPVTASVEGLTEDEGCAFTIHLEKNGGITLSDFFFRGDEVSSPDLTTRMGKRVSTPVGRVTIVPAAGYKAGEERTVFVSRASVVGSATNLLNSLTAAHDDDKNSIINLTYVDVSPKRAEDILSSIIAVYNENWVRDKNQVAVATSHFIDERLRVVEQELGHVDNSISSYKSEHLIPDVQAVSSLYMNQASSASDQALNLNNQLQMARYIRAFLTNGSNSSRLLPANSGLGSSAIESQIAAYNEKLLQRNSLVSNSSSANPIVADMDVALAAMRTAIVTSIDNQIDALGVQLKSFRERERQSTSSIASNPRQAKYLLSVERQQKVKESLYLFLLQKREENELSQAFTAYNTRIVTPPTGQPEPTGPVKRNFLLIAFVVALLLPTAIVFVMENINNKLRGRKDMEVLTAPLVGEIPYHGVEEKKGLLSFLKKKKRKVHSYHQKEIVVKEGNRDIINEAFRVLRSNLDLMAPAGSRASVTVVTSFNPGSGKSFVAMNLATSFAISNRRTLIIDGDMRHGSVSRYVPLTSHGLSEYLSAHAEDWHTLVSPVAGCGNLFVLPVGAVPPNPTELLEGGRLATLLDEARGEFDCILVDCPPVDIVADTQIIEKMADRTLFLVRVGLLDRSMLPLLEDIYTEKRFKNLSLVLNGTKSGSGRYGYGYAQRYGYRYGYGSSFYGSQKS